MLFGNVAHYSHVIDLKYKANLMPPFSNFGCNQAAKNWCFKDVCHSMKRATKQMLKRCDFTHL